MDILEKAEVLKEKANISYEEAKRVLEETNGDLLDAMVILERQGKISRPETEMIMRDAAAAGQEEESGKDEEAGKAAPESAKSSKSCGRKFTKTLEKLIHVMKDNFFHVSRKGKDLFMMPVWVFALILLFAWKMVIPVMLISLFFGVRYSFEGTEDVAPANDFMDKMGNMAEEVASGLKA